MSTVCPGTINHLSFDYPGLYLFHCPEFLSSTTRNIDMYHSKNVILGVPPRMSCAMTDHAYSFLTKLHPSASIKIVKAIESEIAKLFCNVFYAIKLRTFNGIYSVCQKNTEYDDAQYDIVRQLMIDQGWIYPLHTFAPNIDGRLTVGGNCLPKDCKAAFYWLKKMLAKKENKLDELYFAMDDLKSMLSNFIL
jgi:UDP-glucose 6-dehydrogenase